MSESKHTPGPWTICQERRQIVDPRLGEWWEIPIAVGEGATIGNALAVVYMGGPGATRNDVESLKANARLFAAAPDLLAALKRAVELYGKPGGPWNVPSEPGSWLAQATEAIAAAEDVR